MKRDEKDSGLRKHRPKKKFRFEYIQGKYSGMTKERWEWRLFDQVEREIDGVKRIQEILKDFWRNRK